MQSPGLGDEWSSAARGGRRGGVDHLMNAEVVRHTDKTNPVPVAHPKARCHPFAWLSPALCLMVFRLTLFQEGTALEHSKGYEDRELQA
jgi:hypothetical protein